MVFSLKSQETAKDGSGAPSELIASWFFIGSSITFFSLRAIIYHKVARRKQLDISGFFSVRSRTGEREQSLADGTAQLVDWADVKAELLSKAAV